MFINPFWLNVQNVCGVAARRVVFLIEVAIHVTRARVIFEQKVLCDVGVGDDDAVWGHNNTAAG